jgi:hypothetical protein
MRTLRKTEIENDVRAELFANTATPRQSNPKIELSSDS